MPIPAYLLPVPLPVRMEVHYGEPMLFEGSGTEEDETIYAHVDAVKRAIRTMLRERLVALGREPAEGLS